MSGNCVGHLRMGAVPDFDVVPAETAPAEPLPSAVSVCPGRQAAHPWAQLPGPAEVQRGLACSGLTGKSGRRQHASLSLHPPQPS